MTTNQNHTIPGLLPAAPLTGSEMLPVAQGSKTKRTTIADVRAGLATQTAVAALHAQLDALVLTSGGNGPLLVAKIAGETLGGHRVVWVDSDGHVYYASKDTLSVERILGVTTGAASAGALATIQASGELIEVSWNWVPGPVYLGLTGLLTQTNPISGALVEVGIATAPTALCIRVQAPIYLV